LQIHRLPESAAGAYWSMTATHKAARHKENRMALIVHFTPKGMNDNKYAEILRRLEAAGAGAPQGRLHHTCYGASDELQVVDVFDTQANFEAFGKTLVPILASLGVDVGQPNVTPVHNIIRG
jgi:hypothetical protein